MGTPQFAAAAQPVCLVEVLKALAWVMKICQEDVRQEYVVYWRMPKLLMRTVISHVIPRAQKTLQLLQLFGSYRVKAFNGSS